MSGWAQRAAERQEDEAADAESAARECARLAGDLAANCAEVAALRARLAEMEALALGSYLRQQAHLRRMPPRPKGSALDRLCTAAHDLANRYIPVIEAQELLVQRMRAPGASDPAGALRRVVELCDRDGWLAKRRENLRAELDSFDAAMDALLAEARAVLAADPSPGP